MQPIFKLEKHLIILLIQVIYFSLYRFNQNTFFKCLTLHQKLRKLSLRNLE